MGWRQAAIVTNLVVIYGTGGVGFFEYSGTPALGNKPILYETPPGVTADPYGNTLPTTTGGLTSARYTGGTVQQLAQLVAGTVIVLGGSPAAYTSVGGLVVNSGSDQMTIAPPTGPGHSAPILFLTPGTSPQVTVNAHVLLEEVLQTLISSAGGPAVTSALLEVQGSAAVQGIDLILSGALETWHSVAPTLAGFGGSINYKKLAQTAQAQVVMRLSIAAGTAIANNATIGTLPAGYRPTGDNTPLVGALNQFGVTGSAFGPLNISTAGVITWTGAAVTVPAGGFSFLYSVPTTFPTDL